MTLFDLSQAQTAPFRCVLGAASAFAVVAFCAACSRPPLPVAAGFDPGSGPVAAGHTSAPARHARGEMSDAEWLARTKSLAHAEDDTRLDAIQHALETAPNRHGEAAATAPAAAAPEDASPAPSPAPAPPSTDSN